MPDSKCPHACTMLANLLSVQPRVCLAWFVASHQYDIFTRHIWAHCLPAYSEGPVPLHAMSKA
eukprot:16166350-Heterocapsa_arctica.AAC.1